MPKVTGLVIPEDIARAYEEYGFDKKLETAVASRTADGWFAILFKDSGSYYAVDFCPTLDGWEVQNDYIGPFDTVADFQEEKLTRSFF